MKRIAAFIVVACILCPIAFAGIEEAKKLQKEKKYAEAEAEYRKALPELKGEEALGAQFQIGMMLKLQKKHEESIEEFRKVESMDKVPIALLTASIVEIGNSYSYQKKYDEALTEYRKALPNLTGTPSAEIQFQIGDILRLQKKFAEAIGEYQKVEKIEGVNPFVLARSVYYSGLCFSSIRKFDQAIETYRRLENMEKAPASFKALSILNIARYYESVKKNDEALAEYRKVERIKGALGRHVEQAKARITYIENLAKPGE